MCRGVLIACMSVYNVHIVPKFPGTEVTHTDSPTVFFRLRKVCFLFLKT